MHKICARLHNMHAVLSSLGALWGGRLGLLLTTCRAISRLRGGWRWWCLCCTLYDSCGCSAVFALSCEGGVWSGSGGVVRVQHYRDTVAGHADWFAFAADRTHLHRCWCNVACGMLRAMSLVGRGVRESEAKSRGEARRERRDVWAYVITNAHRGGTRP